MGKLFGTDGIRGVVGQNLTAELAFRVGQAVAVTLRQDLGRRPKITIGKDTRISSDMLEAALSAGICSVGGDVLLLGTVPTPAVAFLTVQEAADAGVVISASHNPYEHNGIKVFNAKGYKLPDAMEEHVEALILSGEGMPVATGGDLGRCRNTEQEMHEDYIQHLISTVGCDLSGLRVLVDCANGAASATAPDLFQRLPVMADFINIDPDGVNINSGCGSTHLGQLSAMTAAGKYHLGIAFDGDADRCLLVDETGAEIDGDKIMAVCGMALRRVGKLRGNTIVGTVMSNLGLHEFCCREGIDLVCTAVGDRNVLEKMLECDYAIGGEQSGHMIFREFATTGDGELTALQFLAALKASGLPASELVSCCAKYPQELINVELSHTPGEKERVMASPELWQAVKEQEEKLGGEGRVLIRPSGTEPLIRVMVEAKTDEIARTTAEFLSEVVKSLSKIVMI